jgi:hypothetical protein
MLRTSYRSAGRKSSSKDELTGIQKNMAMHMIGHAVKLLVDARTITGGIVTGVAAGNAGTPKLVVDGARYDLSQILTVTPAYIN